MANKTAHNRLKTRVTRVLIEKKLISSILTEFG